MRPLWSPSPLVGGQRGPLERRALGRESAAEAFAGSPPREVSCARRPRLPAPVAPEGRTPVRLNGPRPRVWAASDSRSGAARGSPIE